MKSSTISAVVGEDQPLFREGLICVLRAAGIDVVAAADNADDLVRKARAFRPDVAVVDIRMPPNFGDDGIYAACEIRALDKRIAVLVLSQFLEASYAFEVLGDRPEGVGYLLKDGVGDVPSFIEAVRRVAGGGTAIDPAVVGRLVDQQRRHDPVGALTKREREVLALMAEGRSNHGIAKDLVVTISAVERHVTSIFGKLGLLSDPADHRRVLAVLRYLQR
jgi:DNA-binding NarL/FixJ family response regulator